MIRALRLLFIAVASVGIMSACEDKPDTPPATLVLTADKSSFTADNMDQVTFTVTQYGVDVTADCNICCQALCLAENKYSTTEPGVYTFYAYFRLEENDPDHKISNTLDVTAVPVDPTALVLTADKSTFTADGEEEVTFTVTQGGLDVTAHCSICTETFSLDGNKYSTEEPGEYTFYAYITAVADNPDRKTSNTVGVTALPMGVPPTVNGWEIAVDSDFDAQKSLVKNVMFITHTGTWCPPCYTFKKSLSDGGPLDERIIHVNFYTFQCEPQVMSYLSHVYIKQYEAEGKGRLKVPGYPTTIVELDKAINDTRDLVVSNFNEYSTRPAQTGIQVESETSDNGHTVNFKVTVGAQSAGSYSVGAFLIEDNVVAFQHSNYAELGAPPIGIADYKHKGVLREESMQNVYGDEIGPMKAGEVRTKEFSFNKSVRDPRIANQNYNTSNLYLVIYTLNNVGGNKAVANCVKVPANGSVDFQYAN